MTAAQATGEPAASCSSAGQPLVVDWAPHERADLEEAMHDGVAVVSYDCKSLRLLKDCHVDGSYGFLPVSKKEQVVRFENADEIVANMPGFGLPLVKELDAELSRGSTLDLAMILVGKKRTTVRGADKSVLSGGPDCASATHFVRGAFVGAFTMGTGTRGQASLGTGMFAASSNSSKLSKYRDGAAESCEQMEQDKAPASCSALLRLELAALGDAPPGAGAAPPPPTCPPGYVFGDDKCAPVGMSAKHLCTTGNLNECTEQCGLSDAGSCNNLGVMYDQGRGAPKDPSRAATLFKQACGLGDGNGCLNLGVLMMEGRGVRKDDVAASVELQKACDQGVALSCRNLAVLHRMGRVGPPDMQRAFSYFKQACDGGDAIGCWDVGIAYQKGRGVAQDAQQAAALFKRACDGGAADGCWSLGELAKDANPPDWSRALPLYTRACDAGSMGACLNLGVFYDNGMGIAKDQSRATELFKRACEGGDATGCTYWGMSFDRVASSKAQAAQLYKRGCDGGNATGCGNLAVMTENGQGIAANQVEAGRLYRKACTLGNAPACDAAKRLGY